MCNNTTNISVNVTKCIFLYKKYKQNTNYKCVRKAQKAGIAQLARTFRIFLKNIVLFKCHLFIRICSIFWGNFKIKAIKTI